VTGPRRSLEPQESSLLHNHQARRSLSDDLSSSPRTTGFRGIMELGGASFQITFLPLASSSADGTGPEGGTVPVKLPGRCDLCVAVYVL